MIKMLKLIKNTRLYNDHYTCILVTFFWETEHFSGRIGALRWSILVGKQKHNVQKPTCLWSWTDWVQLPRQAGGCRQFFGNENILCEHHLRRSSITQQLNFPHNSLLSKWRMKHFAPIWVRRRSIKDASAIKQGSFYTATLVTERAWEENNVVPAKI